MNTTEETCDHEVDWSKWPQSIGICEKCGMGVQKPQDLSEFFMDPKTEYQYRN